MDSMGLVTVPCSAMASIIIACMSISMVDCTYLVTSTACSVIHTVVVEMMEQQMTDFIDFKT